MSSINDEKKMNKKFIVEQSEVEKKLGKNLLIFCRIKIWKNIYQKYFWKIFLENIFGNIFENIFGNIFGKYFWTKNIL